MKLKKLGKIAEQAKNWLKRALRKSSGNVEKNQSKEDYSRVVEREQLDGTPFWIMSSERGSWLVMGKYRFTEAMPRKKLDEYLEEHSWTIILQMISAVINDNEQLKQEMMYEPDLQK